ncbi:MAG: methyltransferase family protein [Planctomycetota bacterium]|jgi:protein-S-isoprenylcysteine O-methyltransferase Ste14
MDEDAFRWALGLVLGAALIGSAVLRARARRAGADIRRRQEGSAMVALRIALAGPLAAALLTWLVRPDWMAWSTVPLPAVVRWAGLAVAAAGAAVALVALSRLGANVSPTTLTRAGQQLVTAGPYALVRHPLYTGGALLLLGATMLTASWLVGALTLVGLAAIRLVIVPREEAALFERFGRAYDDYRDRTGAMIPRWRGAPRRGP